MLRQTEMIKNPLTCCFGPRKPYVVTIGDANGAGATIEIINANAAEPYAANNWRVSAIGGSPGTVATVPEPSTALLGSHAALALLRRRR